MPICSQFVVFPDFRLIQSSIIVSKKYTKSPCEARHISRVTAFGTQQVFVSDWVASDDSYSDISANRFHVSSGAFFHHTMKSRSFLLCVITLFCVRGGHSPLFAQRSVSAHPRVANIAIDGVLSESDWQRAPITSFVQREPDEGTPASEQTEVWVSYDSEALYVAARMHDHSPDSIVARLVRRDEGFDSDWFRVFIDTNYDRLTGYVFATNPTGSISDGLYYDDNKVDLSWDGVWSVGVKRDSHGWSVEFRIPFSQLRFERRDPFLMGIEFERRIHRKNEYSYLTLHPLNDQVRVSRWSQLSGLEGVDPPTRREFIPYVATTAKFVESPPVQSFNKGRTDPYVVGRDYFAHLGADLKIGLTGDLTMDAALNPDFAQVEVDPAVVNLTAYETYFEEKRPFFLEGSTILRFGQGGATSLMNFNWSDPMFFYSRRIGRAPQGKVHHIGFIRIPDRTTILGAAKISGKTETGWSLAALTAVTEREYGSVDSAGIRFDEEIEPLSAFTLVRAKREFSNSRHSIGLLGTYVERDIRTDELSAILNRRAMTLGIDGWYSFDDRKEWILTGWTGLSRVEGNSDRIFSLQHSSQHYFQRPDATHVTADSSATSLTGWATRIWLSKDRGNLRINGAIGVINPSFELNDLGFHSKSDIVNTHLYVAYSWFEPDRVFRYKSIGAAVLQEFNFGGLRTAHTYVLLTNLMLRSYWGGYVFLGYDGESFDDRLTRGGPLSKLLSSIYTSMYFYSDSRKNVSGTLSLFGSKNESGAWNISSSFNINFKPSKATLISVGPSVSRRHSMAQYVATINDITASQTFGKRYVFATLDQTTLAATIRLNMTFTPRLSLQLYTQPFLAAGDYCDLKELAQPRTFRFNTYGMGESSITRSGSFYDIDPDGPLGPAARFSVLNRSFNIGSLKANVVLRWEFLPGSTLYAVWTNMKSFFEPYGRLRLVDDIDLLLRDRPDNVLSLKLSYWLSP